MPEPIRCDVCKAVGVRQLAYTCPDNWFYAEILVEDLQQVVVFYACTPDCRDRLWKRGPGPRIPGVDKYIARLQGRGAAQRCIFSEGNCKAADCPEHGIFPRRDS